MRAWIQILISGIVVTASCGRIPKLPKGVTWDAGSGAFGWWDGEVSLPGGFRYQVDVGGDSFQGHFTSADGRVVVQHDVGAGYIVGHYANKKDAVFFREQVVDGVRVWFAARERTIGDRGKTMLVAVTFPDSGNANFFLYSSRPEDTATIEFIARSFHPKARGK